MLLASSRILLAILETPLGTYLGRFLKLYINFASNGDWDKQTKQKQDTNISNLIKLDLKIALVVSTFLPLEVLFSLASALLCNSAVLEFQFLSFVVSLLKSTTLTV